MTLLQRGHNKQSRMEFKDVIIDLVALVGFTSWNANNVPAVSAATVVASVVVL